MQLYLRGAAQPPTSAKQKNSKVLHKRHTRNLDDTLSTTKKIPLFTTGYKKGYTFKFTNVKKSTIYKYGGTILKYRRKLKLPTYYYIDYN